MKLTFLGTRGEVEETSKFHKNHSAIRLETHNKIILLDFGASWQGKLKFINPDYIWISHAHPDHCLGLKTEKVDVPVFMSKETSDRLPEDKFSLQNRKIVKDNFQFDSIKAQEIPINHSFKAPMSGLIIETDEGKVGYFPDVLDMSDKSMLKGLSIYIGDGSSLTRDIVRTIKRKRVGHKSMAAQMAFFKETEKWKGQTPMTKIIFTHLGKEAIEMKHEKLVQRILELSDKFCPDIPVEIAIDNATFGVPSKPVKKSMSSQEEILSNYLGSKRQFVNTILKYIPEGTKTLFDPMAGSSHLLIEAAKHGIQIIGNDLCPLAYYYSAGIFQGEKLNEGDEKILKNSPSISGWLSKSELKRPERLESKRLIDGLMIGAYKRFSGGKQKTALAAMSLLLQHYFRGFAAFISEEEPYSREQILGDLSKCIKDVNELIGEVGGKGKIFNKNILNGAIPRADVIYFDPPYFPAGPQEAINYFKHYVHANSVLMQKKFEQEDPTKEDIINFIPKLASKTNLLIVSTSSPSAINWGTELSKLKKNVKMIGISKSSTGSQPQGERANPVTARNVKEHLFCASDSEIKIFERLEKLLFKVESYDLSKIDDTQLENDLKLVAMKWNSILQGKKTEFKNKEECLDFAKRIMEEVLKRGKITFRPEYKIINGKAEITE